MYARESKDKRILKHLSTFNTLDEMDETLEKLTLPKLTQEEIYNLNSHIPLYVYIT